MNNYFPRKVWCEITYPRPDFNGGRVEVEECMGVAILLFKKGVITNPFWS